MVKQFKKTFGSFFKSFNMDQLYESSISLLGIQIWPLKMYIHTKTFTWMFNADFFVIGSTWKQYQRSSTTEWITKLCSIHIMEYYAVELLMLEVYKILSLDGR